MVSESCPLMWPLKQTLYVVKIHVQQTDRPDRNLLHHDKWKHAAYQRMMPTDRVPKQYDGTMFPSSLLGKW